MSREGDEAAPPVQHARVVEYLRWMVRVLRARAIELRELAARASAPSPMGLFWNADEPGLLIEDAKTAERQLERCALELEAICVPAARDSAARLRVLLVERNGQLASALGAVLGQRYELVGIVSRASQALAVLVQESSDVVIVGEQLAGEMSGRQLLAFVAAHWPSVRRILRTDEPAEEVADAAIAQSATSTDVIAAIDRLS